MNYRTAGLCVLLPLAGCSSIQDNPIYGESGVIRDRSKEYAYAEPGKRLAIPESLQAKSTRDGLIVPEVNSPQMTEVALQYDVPRPEFFFASSGSDRASIRPLEGERVILVDEPIDQVWNEVLGYWTTADVNLASRDARTGTMETEWIVVEGEDLTTFQRLLNTLKFKSEANEDSINRLRLRLRPDPENVERTAISLEQVQYPISEKPAVVDWQADATELDYSNGILYSMLDYLSRGDSPALAPTLSSYEEGRGPVAEMGQDSRNRPLLSLKAPVDESWTLVNTALDNAGIDVGTRNQEKGIVYLTFYTLQQDQEFEGFFDWLLNREVKPITIEFGGSAPAEEEDADAVYSSDPDAIVKGAKPTQEELQSMEGFKIWIGGRVVYVFGQDNQSRQNADGQEVIVKRYQLRFNRARSGVLLSVHNSDGEIVSESAAEELLWAIKDSLAI